jgi:hypothetical protein
VFQTGVMWFAVLLGVGVGIASLTVLSRYPGTPNKDLAHDRSSDSDDDRNSDADDAQSGGNHPRPSSGHAAAVTTATLRRRGQVPAKSSTLSSPSGPIVAKDPLPSETLQQAVFGTSDPAVIRSAIASAHRQAAKLVRCKYVLRKIR